MNFLFPKIAVKRLPGMLWIALIGAAVAGLYGALHDQISYSISPEYFTKLKFHQFWYANVGWPPRVYALEVGFLASWWVGLIGGWILARMGLDRFPVALRRKCLIRAFAIVLGVAFICGAIGANAGSIRSRGNLSDWKEWKDVLELKDLSSFIVVAYLHAGSYAGALLGVVAAAIYIKKSRPNVGEVATPM